MENQDSGNNFKKFSPPNDPIELEKANPNMMPTGGETLKAIEVLRDKEKDTGLINGYNFIIAKKKAEEAEDKAKLCHFNDFNAFLLGLGGYGNDASNSTYKTPEFIQNFFKGSYKHNKEVQRYIRSLMAKKMNFQKKLVDLNREGPETLEECYIFWKYLIRRYATIDENDYLLLFNTNLDDDGNIEIMKRDGKEAKPSANEPVTFLKPNIPPTNKQKPFKYCNNGITFISGFDQHSCKVIDKFGIILHKIHTERKASLADIFQFVDDIAKIKFEGFEKTEDAMRYYVENLEEYRDYTQIINKQIELKLSKAVLLEGTKVWENLLKPDEIIPATKTNLEQLNEIIVYAEQLGNNPPSEISKEKIPEISEEKIPDVSSLEKNPVEISMVDLEKEINRHKSATVVKNDLDKILLYILDNNAINTGNEEGIAEMVDKITEETKKGDYDDKVIDEFMKNIKETAEGDFKSDEIINQMSKLYSDYVFHIGGNTYIQAVGYTYVKNREDQLNQLNKINDALKLRTDEITDVFELCKNEDDPINEKTLRQFIESNTSLSITASIATLAALKSENVKNAKTQLSKEINSNNNKYESMKAQIETYIKSTNKSRSDLEGVIGNIKVSIENISQFLKDNSPQLQQQSVQIKEFYREYKGQLRQAIRQQLGRESKHRYIHTETRPTTYDFWNKRKDKDNWTKEFDDARFDIKLFTDKYKVIAQEKKDELLSQQDIETIKRTYKEYKFEVKKEVESEKDLQSLKEISGKLLGEESAYETWGQFYLEKGKDYIIAINNYNLAEVALSADTIQKLSTSKILFLFAPEGNAWNLYTKNEAGAYFFKKLTTKGKYAKNILNTIGAEAFNKQTSHIQLQFALQLFDMDTIYNAEYAEEYNTILAKYDQIFKEEGKLEPVNILSMMATMNQIYEETEKYRTPELTKLYENKVEEINSTDRRYAVKKDKEWMSRIANEATSMGTVVLNDTMYSAINLAAVKSEKKVSNYIKTGKMAEVGVSEKLLASITKETQVAKYTIINGEKEKSPFSLATNLSNFISRPPTVSSSVQYGAKKGVVGNKYALMAVKWAEEFLKEVNDIYIFKLEEKKPK